MERGNIRSSKKRLAAKKELKVLTGQAPTTSAVDKDLIRSEPPKLAMEADTKRTLALTGFGAAALPAAEALTSKIRTGTFMRGASPKRWLLSQVPQALLWGAAFPTAGKMINKAFPGKPQPAAPTPLRKAAASKKSAKYQQLRTGRRPIRVDTLLNNEKDKQASPTGKDLRAPMAGGTKFPTNDSLKGPKSLLTKSMGKSEAGPTPSLSSLTPSGPTIPDVSPTVPGAQNLMPKVGSDMDIEKDPLVQYIKKQAAEDIPKKVTPEKGGVLPGNITDMKTGPGEKENTAEPPQPEKEHVTRSQKHTKSTLVELFTHPQSRKKYEVKDHTPKSGVVDRILAATK